MNFRPSLSVDPHHSVRIAGVRVERLPHHEVALGSLPGRLLFDSAYDLPNLHRRAPVVRLPLCKRRATNPRFFVHSTGTQTRRCALSR